MTLVIRRILTYDFLLILDASSSNHNPEVLLLFCSLCKCWFLLVLYQSVCSRTCCDLNWGQRLLEHLLLLLMMICRNLFSHKTVPAKVHTPLTEEQCVSCSIVQSILINVDIAAIAQSMLFIAIEPLSAVRFSLSLTLLISFSWLMSSTYRFGYLKLVWALIFHLTLGFL